MPDPELERRGEEGGLPQIFIGPFGPQFRPKIGGGGRPSGPLPWICHRQIVAKTEPYVGMVLSVFLCTLKVFTQNAVDAWSRLAGLYYVLFFELVEALFFGWELLSRFSDGGQGSLPIKLNN